MKQLLLIVMLNLACLSIIAQEQKPKIDESRIIGTTKPSAQLKIELKGFINTPSADLKWRPILSKKTEEFEPKVPNEKILDSIIAEKTLLKGSHSKGLRNAPTSTASVNPTIGNNFQGNYNGGNMTPLDNTMAISNGGWIVSAINGVIEYFDTIGNNYYINSLVSFLNDPTVKGVCDPALLYDAGSDRFIFFCQDAPMFASDTIFVCFSVSNNPTDGWYVYELTGDPLGVGDAFDYPKIAVSNNELFLTGNLYSEPSDTYDQSVVYQIDKTLGYSGSAINWVYWHGISGSPFTILPVSYGQNGSYGPGIYAVSTAIGGSSAINLYEITNDQYHSPVMNYYSVPTTAYSPAGNASQLGTTCQLNSGIGSCRSLSGFYLNGLIHFVFHCDIGSGWCGINYNRLNVSSLTNKSVECGYAGTDDFAYPSVVSYAISSTDASVMIGFGISGASIYPEIGVINCDNLMNWSPNSIVVQSGYSYVNYISSPLERWGDYTGTSRFHVGTSPTIWMNGMYGANTNIWSTWIAEIIGQTTLTGINAITKDNSAKVYPNPIINTFSLDFTLDAETNLSIAIEDINGREIKQLYLGKGKPGENNFSFNKANLTSGVYFLTIKSNSNIIKSEKIIITN